MKKYTLLTVIGAAALAMALPVFTLAQNPDPHMPNSTVTPVFDLPRLFATLDRDHDGYVSVAEFGHLHAALAGIGAGLTGRAGEADSSVYRANTLNDDDMHAVFSKLDTNGDNMLSLPEFMWFNAAVAQNGGKK